MTGDQYESVWDAIADTPEEAEALKTRAAVMRAINDRLDEFGWSQTVAAENIGVAQPRISDLRTGKLSRFSLEALIEIARKVGLEVEVKIASPSEQAPCVPT